MTKGRLAVVVALVAVAVVAITLVAGGDDEADTSTTAVPTSTAEITRGDLVSTETVSGDLTFEATRPIVNQASGVMTWRPDAGAVIDRGGVVYKVDDQPVVLLLGDTPVYREMSTDSTTGPDVVQLQANLIALGHGAGVQIDGDYDSATAAAVEAFETAVGLEPDGIVQRGEITFAPTAIRVASAAVDVGGAVQSGGSVLEATGTTTVVTTSVSSDQANRLPVGTVVTIQLPDDTTTRGTVASLEAATADQSSQDPQAAGPTGGDAGFTATIRFDDPAAAADFDTASVDVVLADETAEDVLSVPVTALVALAEGGYAVEVVDDGGGSHLVGVSTGLYADERVEVDGRGLAAGDTVVVPA